MALSKNRIKALEEEPLSEFSRKERRALLGFSVLALMIALCDLIPQKISALGVEITGTQQGYLKWVFFGLIVYFLVAFSISGLQDWLAWRGRIHEGLSADMKEGYESQAVSQGRMQAPNHSYTPGKQLWKEAWKEVESFHPIKIAWRLYWIRVGFEFLIPLGVGLIALYCLVSLDMHSAAVKSHEATTYSMTQGLRALSPWISPH